MSNLTIKKRIIKTLLESPKTTGQIAIELGYIDNKGNGRYNVIKPDLNTLEQYGFIHRIERKDKRPGAPATTYDLVYELSAIKAIIEKYPSLISDLQNNDYICSLLFEKHRWIKDIPNSCRRDVFEVIKSMPLEKQIVYENWFNGKLLEAHEETILGFKKKLRLSPSFFILFVGTEPHALEEIINKIYQISVEAHLRQIQTNIHIGRAPYV